MALLHRCFYRHFDIVSTDLIGPLTLTEQGHRYILVVTDFVTRYCVIRPLIDKRATTVAEGLWSILCEHGTPSTLYSDQGPEFRNKILKEMSKNFQFSHKWKTTYSRVVPKFSLLPLFCGRIPSRRQSSHFLVDIGCPQKKVPDEKCACSGVREA